MTVTQDVFATVVRDLTPKFRSAEAFLGWIKEGCA